MDRPPLSDVKTTIVRSATAGLVQRGEHAADRRIELLEHRRIDRVVLHEPHA